jgi:uncharacterized SAM-binding protein YcdF (DUF218 family)
MHALYKETQLLLTPELWIFSCLIVAWLLFRSPRRQASARWFLLVAIALFYILGTGPAGKTLIGALEARYQPPTPLEMQGHDALVVLAGGIKRQPPNGSPTILGTLSLDRLICGVTLFKEGRAPVLVLSGGIGDAFQKSPPEADEMRNLAIRLGVPPSALVSETGSRTTAESAVEVRRALPRLRRILLVTSAFHLPRATALFRKQGFEQVTPVPCGYELSTTDFGLKDLIPSIFGFRLVTYAVHEYVGIAVYRMLGRL